MPFIFPGGTVICEPIFSRVGPKKIWTLVILGAQISGRVVVTIQLLSIRGLAVMNSCYLHFLFTSWQRACGWQTVSLLCTGLAYTIIVY